MSDLEDFGLLAQPHTSAGRVPTDVGLRFYVDSILEIRDIPGQDQEAIRQELTGVSPEAEQIIKRAAKVLSSVSKHVGVVVAPKFSRVVLKQIQFAKVSAKSILVILVGLSGIIQNRIIETEEELSQDDLDRFNRYLNDLLEGLTIPEIKKRLVDEMREEKNQFDAMLSRALALSQKVFDADADEGDVYIDGHVNLLDYPEFADVHMMKSLFRAFEDKGILVKLLDQTVSAQGVQIFIGSETELAQLQGLTVIASNYRRGARALGTLGVIGPTRLNYQQVIPVVDFTANLVSRILETNT
jgi:heat-inducible transcriptional repressor